MSRSSEISGRVILNYSLKKADGGKIDDDTAPDLHQSSMEKVATFFREGETSGDFVEKDLNSVEYVCEWSSDFRTSSIS